MTDAEITVIGAGPSGMVAATTLSKVGYHVEIIEQRETLGGAIYRQPVESAMAGGPAAGSNARWKTIRNAFVKQAIPVRCGTVFLGIDGDGLVLIEDRRKGRVERLRRKGVVVAVGAVEKVYPRTGWHLPGVSTAGGLQVMMKETGRAPEGRVLLAGNGPLLIAVAAQMARLGNPPAALVEAGDPFGHMATGVALLKHPALLQEALLYLMDVYRSRIPWLRGAHVTSIEKEGPALLVRIERKGLEKRMSVDRIGLHDGIRCNDFGLPPETLSSKDAPVVVRAGDCREALGAIAAEADGARAAQRLANILSGSAEASGLDAAINRTRQAQDLLARLFAPIGNVSPLAICSDETILCRCEAKTVGDLRSLCQHLHPMTGREVKLNGRFAMGACQGRFCADNTASLMALMNADSADLPPRAEDLTGRRWPVRPVSIAALTAAANPNTEKPNNEVEQDDAS
ncbi:MAG: FAD-dependent oxidoreductase [Hoeflea sp.]|uniref:NAD(P)-binding protein n=1 Tax=Hoeflea sp. TaxID=1940281 RepID=UPI001DB0312C|nr:NAD(P)-binding protein [Hoeflea sp.]MBU4531937.1 FAD-dependent oxidoreductase [Alphaproteobacteria bacterium]MBU4546359.1 FAD-dependent oxidoreductase [Alphaproteobacteria bacterium]MBU4549488.1 FAD-dependent oxidoreductase [Alphaproteobacteria bacterium]MBV1722663.1 FAD-dependent oxidoreductase [Hoeflea sp.]MBV1782601.1 FAD-dependent oxidoreductase [Hoeflea sp.]